MALSARPTALTLGTATLGMPYGIGNPGETPSPQKTEQMLDLAWNGGIRAFDTAPVYGEAEARLGQWITRRGFAPYVATKLPSLAAVPDSAVPAAVREAISASTHRLGTRPTAYLTHGASDYRRQAVREQLREAVARRGIAAAGASVYTEAEVMAVLEAGPPEAIQIPVSAFDRRLINGGALAACRTAGVTVFARSVFLQGIMLMDPARLPAAFAAMRPAIEAFEALCIRSGTTRASFALRYVRDLPGISSTVVGAYDVAQLKALIEAANEPALSSAQRAEMDAITNEAPASLLDPRSWPKA